MLKGVGKNIGNLDTKYQKILKLTDESTKKIEFNWRLENIIFQDSHRKLEMDRHF